MPDPTPENIESIGLAVRFGNFRLLDLADLTWNQETDLACPKNLLGTFDVFHTTRHGDLNSGSPQLVHAARVAKAHLGLGRMHVDVDAARRTGQRQHAGRRQKQEAPASAAGGTIRSPAGSGS